ncbi:MAG: hypothetical protein K0V04_45900, partial [Deltaproteobacteria bacterium]|nr:hypothetical protein [Deltaproteobacteria bacterium]
TDPRDLTVARADKEGTAASEPVVRGLARAEVRVGGGVLPGVDAGAAVAVGLAHRWFRVELLGAAWLPRDRTIAPNAQLDLQLFTGQLRGCAVVPVPSLPWLEPLPCAGIEVGAMRGQGQGQGLEQGRVALQPWVAVTVTPALAIMPWRRLGFIVGGTLVVPVQRPTFVLSGTQEVYRVSAAAGRGFAGVELRFP